MKINRIIKNSRETGPGMGKLHIMAVRVSVPNCPGPLQGPADGLPRALDETGRRNMSRPRSENQKAAVISKDGRTGNLRQYLS